MQTNKSNGVTATFGRRTGYTMIEMLMVVCVVGMLALISVPKGYVQTYQLDAAARSVRMALQNAQRLALTRQLNVIVSFDVDHNRIRTVEDNNNNGSVNTGERTTYVNLEDGAHFATPAAGVNGSVSSSIVGSGLQMSGGLPSVIFRRDGESSSDLEVYVTSKRAAANDYRAITVVQSTGRTDWYKYIDAAWKAGNL